MKSAARQLMRALRGSETQRAFSTSLGYRSNVAAEWEGGRRFPNALELLRICEQRAIDATRALRDLAPAAAAHVDPEDLGPWLEALRGDLPQTVLARRIGRSRHQVRRWVTGTAVPRIPDFLALVDGLTQRPATLVAGLVDITRVPDLARRLPGERARMRFLAHRREQPVRQALRQAGMSDDAVVVLPLGHAGLDQVRALHADLAARARRVTLTSGEPDAVAVLALGTAHLD